MQAAEVDKTMPLVTDAQLNRYIQLGATTRLPVRRAEVPYTFRS